MPKTAAPWFRAASGTWVVRMHGRQRTLARGKANKAEALARWREIQNEVRATRAAPTSLGALADRFLAHCQANTAEATAVWYARHVGSFVAFLGRSRRLDDVGPLDCLTWLDSTAWSRSTRHGAITAAKRLFSWGRRHGLVGFNPLESIEKPGIGRRERVPSTAEVDQLLAEARPWIRDLLAFLAETGCRQSEAHALLVRHVDLDAGVCSLRGKTTRATGRPRVIYLTEAAAAILERRIQGLDAEASVFVTAAGNPWTSWTMYDAVTRIRERAGLGPHVSAGSLRHWWITERLRAGVPIALVAELAGHRSTAMISRHYGHLAKHSEDLKRAVELKRLDGPGE